MFPPLCAIRLIQGKFQHSNMTLRLSGHFSIIGLVFFLPKSLLSIARQWSREKFAILWPKYRSQGSILIYQTWAIDSNEVKVFFFL